MVAPSMQIVLATGRFQTIHFGSLSYMLRAQDFAARKSAAFFINTGPRDDELIEHGLRVPPTRRRRMLSFAERRSLISVLLAIPEKTILNNRSSPHHGQPGLDAWVKTFFEPLWQALAVSPSVVNESTINVTLATVKKTDDYRLYQLGDEEKHYTDYLVDAYPWLVVLDLDTVHDRPVHRPLSSSTLPPPTTLTSFGLPAVMAAAEVLLEMGSQLTDESSKRALASVYRRYGHEAATYDEVVKMLSSPGTEQ
jgi:hypothetical protein